MTSEEIKTGKQLAILSYVTIIGTVIVYFMNQDKKNAFTAFHTRQALGIWLCYIVLGWVVSAFDSWMITLLFWGFFIVLIISGLMAALAGKTTKVPLVGEYFQKWFSKNI